MAARKNFTVSSSLGVVTKHAYNAAVRETERMIRAHADAQTKTFRLIAKTAEYDDSGFYLVHGTRTWSAADGETITFTIRKEPNA